jgi:hypothetical protein
MALFVVLSLSGAATARAGDWYTIQAGNQTFYLPAERVDAVKPGDPPEPLYFAANEPADPKAKSIATLIKKKTAPTKKKPTSVTKLYVNLLDAAQKQSYLTQAVLGDKVKPAPLPPAGAPPKPMQPQRPQGVDEGLWNVVVSDGKVKPDLQQKVALALQAHPEALKRLSAKKDKLLAAVSQVAALISQNAADSAIEDYFAHAGLTPGSSGVPTTTPGSAVGQGGTGPGQGGTGPGGQVGTGDTASVAGTIVNGPDGKPLVVGDVLEHIGKLLLDQKNADFRKRVADRFNEFLFDSTAPEDRAYIAKAEVDKAGMKDRFSALAGKWIDSSLFPKEKGTSQPHDVAVLYFIMGDEKVPDAMVKADPLMKLLKDSDLRTVMDADKAPMLKRLVANMDCYSNDQGACKADNPGQQFHGQFTGQSSGDDQAGLDSWSTGFFHDASTYAQKIYSGLSLSKVDLTKLVQAGDQPITVPGVGDKPIPVGGGGSDAARIMSSGFTTEDLYGSENDGGAHGAYVARIPNDPTGRLISIRIYTTREPVGTTGNQWQMVDKVGFFDITNPGDSRTPGHIYGRRVALSPQGDSDVQLDDTRPDSISYKIHLGDDGSISIKNKDGAGMETKVNTLYSYRNAQIATMPMVEINKNKFYVGGQGSPKGAYLYYPANADGSAPTADRLTPTLTADGNQVGPSGFAETLTGYQPMGFIGKNKGGDPQFYYLKWNTDLVKFEYKACDEAKPPQKCDFPDVPAAPDTSTPASTKPGKGKTTPGTTAPGTTAPGGGTTAPATTTPTTAPAGSADDGGQTVDPNVTFSAECTADSISKMSENFEARKIDGYTEFVNKPNEGNAQGNNPSRQALNVFHVCYNQARTFFSGGLLMSIKDDQAGDSLAVETAQASEYVPPEKLKNSVFKTGTSQLQPGSGGQPVGISTRMLYYIHKTDLNTTTDSPATLQKVAWLQLSVEMGSGRGQHMDIMSNSVDGAAVAKTIADAFKYGNAKADWSDAEQKAITDAAVGEVTSNTALAQKIPIKIQVLLLDPALKTTITNADPIVTVVDKTVLFYCWLPSKNYGLVDSSSKCTTK